MLAHGCDEPRRVDFSAQSDLRVSHVENPATDGVYAVAHCRHREGRQTDVPLSIAYVELIDFEWPLAAI